MRRKKRTGLIAGIMILTLFLSVASILPSSQQSVTERKVFSTSDFVSKNILVDKSHTGDGSGLWTPGNASLFGWIQMEHGYNVSNNFYDPLDSGILAGYDILALFFPKVNLTEGEVSAIQTFVDNGGGLLLVGVDNTNFWSIHPDYLNPLAATYGITFNSDIEQAVTSNLLTHQITAGVTSMGTAADELRSCTLSLLPPATSIVEGATGTVAAVAEVGTGRVVAVGGPAPFYMMRQRAWHLDATHSQFSLNIIDWLAKNDQRSVSLPDTAVIYVGNGPDLSEEEVLGYSAFSGLYHDHTTHSDGEHSAGVMAETATRIGMDFLVLTDHSKGLVRPDEGVAGGLEAQQFVMDHGLDLVQVVGAELSSVAHTTGFPLTENIYTYDQQEAVDEIHAQGGIATLCHPTYSSKYGLVYENLDVYGYDAFEIDNDGFFFTGEGGYLHNFLGASDGHSAYNLGEMMNFIFVHPTGPDGTLHEMDIVDAVLNRRVVVLDKLNNLVLGEKLWVDRYFNLTAEATAVLSSATSMIDGLRASALDVGLSELYLSSAETALNSWNPARALRLIANATSNAALNLDLTFSELSIVQPDSDNVMSITLTNNHTFSVRANTSQVTSVSMATGPSKLNLEAPAKGTDTIERTAHTVTYGLTESSVNVYSFNTSEYLMPLLIYNSGIIENVEHSVTDTEAGYEVYAEIWIGRNSAATLQSLKLYYDDGSGYSTATLDVAWNSFYATLGPFDAGLDITFYFEVVTDEGILYELGGTTVELPDATTTTTIPTTTTTTGTTTPPPPPEPIDPTLLLMIGGGIGVVIVVLVIFAKRR